MTSDMKCFTFFEIIYFIISDDKMNVKRGKYV